jgi:hypothetical protein
VKPLILALALFAAHAPCAPCLDFGDLTWGARAGAGGSLLWGGWADQLEAELMGLGASTVTPQAFFSWRLGGWAEIPLTGWLFARVEADLGPVGGARLASDGYDMLVGVAAYELALPVLAVARFALPFGEVTAGAGIFIAGAVPVREIWNDGAVRSAGNLTTLLASVGLAGGAGYVFPVGPGAIAVDLRVLASLYSLGEPGIGGSLNTVSFELSAGWEFKP